MAQINLQNRNREDRLVLAEGEVGWEIEGLGVWGR